jgi:hypothetical protein
LKIISKLISVLLIWQLFSVAKASDVFELYQVQKGDTLGEILKQKGLSPLWGSKGFVRRVYLLMGYDPSDDIIIRPGQKILIPKRNYVQVPRVPASVVFNQQPDFISSSQDRSLKPKVYRVHSDFSFSPFVNYTKVNLTDSQDGSTATLISDTNVGVRVGWMQFWSKELTSIEVNELYARHYLKYYGSFESEILDMSQGFGSTVFSSISWKTDIPFYKSLTGSTGNETSTDYAQLVGTTGTIGDNNLMSGIQYLYHLDESSGTSGVNSVIDSSGNNYHGTPFTK